MKIISQGHVVIFIQNEKPVGEINILAEGEEIFNFPPPDQSQKPERACSFHYLISCESIGSKRIYTTKCIANNGAIISRYSETKKRAIIKVKKAYLLFLKELA